MHFKVKTHLINFYSSYRCKIFHVTMLFYKTLSYGLKVLASSNLAPFFLSLFILIAMCKSLSAFTLKRFMIKGSQ